MLSTSLTSCMITINTDTPATIISHTIVTPNTTTVTIGTTTRASSYCSSYGVPSLEAVNGEGGTRAVFKF